MQQHPILQTKLHIPPVRPDLVPRPRLIDRLNAELPAGRRLTLVSAPAGFGKTTLVSSWIHDLPSTIDTLRPGTASQGKIASRVAWLSLDEDDNDPARFLAYVVAALRTVVANIGKGILRALQSPQPPGTGAVLTFLLNEITATPGRIILVLDDYHLIETQAIHDALTFLLDHLPPQMHLVMATREDPHLPLARLRARGQLTEVRAWDLRFTPSEAAEFLNQVMGLDLSAQDIAVLETRTEGWIAGLQLAALALQGTTSVQGHRDVTHFIQSFSGSHRFVLDYLLREVLQQQPENVQSFLVHTAVLDRLTGSLCDAVRFDDAKAPPGQGDGQAILESLDRSNLFLFPLDDERRWYRYHHLFAELLQQRLRQTHPEQVPELHRRASKWFEHQDLPSDAIRHALAAQDFERAAGLAELAWPAWSVGFRSLAWLGWVKDLPEGLVRLRPVLSLAYAWAFLNAGKLENAETKLQDVERWGDPPAGSEGREDTSPPEMVIVDHEQFRALPASLAMARTYHAQASGDVRGTVKYASQALDLLPEDDHYNRAAVTGLLGLAYWANGDLEAAHTTFAASIFQNAHDLIKGTLVVAEIKTALGHLDEAVLFCEHALQLAAELGEPIGTEDVYSAMSALHRERGDLDAAARDLATGKKLGEQVELPDWQYRWCVAQARLNETRGDLDAALDLLYEAERVYVRTPLPEIRPTAAMKARVWVKQGKLAEALNWVRERELSVDDDLDYPHEFEHITLARVLIAQYKSDRVEDSLVNAMGLVERLLRTAEESRRTGTEIEILVLQALAHQARGNIPPALVPLERALMLAEPEGYLRIFVDEGPPMARLLYEATRRGIASDYVRQLLAAFPLAEPILPGPSSSQGEALDWIEPLSERELEVLQLIAQGLTNRAISARLFLSVNTVKAHTRSIYGKLNVHSRTQAIARSQALGLLPQR